MSRQYKSNTAYWRDWNRKNKEKCAIKNRKWKQKNKDKVVSYAQNRHAKELGAEGIYTDQEIQRIYHDQFETCIACNRKFSEQLKYTVDHIIPLSKGGSNWPDNIQLLCGSCNYSKGAKDMDTWLLYRAR